MTYAQARVYRRNYVLLGWAAAIVGLPTVTLTVLKVGYEFYQQQPGYTTLPFDPFGGILRILLGIIPGPIRWIWPWLSDYGTFEWPLNLVLAPTSLLGWVLIVIAAISLNQERKLKKWISDVKELFHKEEMLASRRPLPAKQSVGNVYAGHDAIVTLNNHYNHRPDNPKIPIIVAVIGAIAVIVAALMGLLHHS